MSTGDWIQLGVGVVLFLTLVGVVWYACEARRAANASLAMAREMREQRMALWQPVVLVDMCLRVGAPLNATTLHAEVYNHGNSPATNLEICLVDASVKREALIDAISQPEFPYGKRMLASGPLVLTQGQEREREMQWKQLGITGDRDYLVAVEHNDMYRRGFRSGILCRFVTKDGVPIDVVNREVVPPVRIRETAGELT